ncbi:polysaccharide deacetylase family protein [uncultured Kriegella sp.]|uniref:polysaccharide deacetylase family protein n=1 Tax=uncultured Kriegella sp. TaxID=1798910 RepID=UPI0030D71783|tara:strand:+ start:78146 stop:78958 length:813 start_codon:yes stop_codon:yes gene_type:complete
MKNIVKPLLISFILALLYCPFLCAQKTPSFQWPDGNTMAVSLTWDDGRSSQVTVGTPILDAHGVKATFYVVPAAINEELKGWRKAVASGHEIGNHSLRHPCSGNFLWARDIALEEYTLEKMQSELAQANDSIQKLLGVTPTEFAYPCGQTFVGRGANTKSYVPVIHNQFSSGRTWLDESPNDPTYCDMAQLTGVEMDGKNFDQILELIESARGAGLWLVLAGHDIGVKNRQTTEVAMLKKLLPYLKDPANKIWTAPLGEISAYVKAQRGL